MHMSYENKSNYFCTCPITSDPRHEWVNPHMPIGSKTTGYFGDISLTKVIFRKYLKEKC